MFLLMPSMSPWLGILCQHVPLPTHAKYSPMSSSLSPLLSSFCHCFIVIVTVIVCITFLRCNIFIQWITLSACPAAYSPVGRHHHCHRFLVIIIVIVLLSSSSLSSQSPDRCHQCLTLFRQKQQKMSQLTHNNLTKGKVVSIQQKANKVSHFTLYNTCT